MKERLFHSPTYEILSMSREDKFPQDSPFLRQGELSISYGSFLQSLEEIEKFCHLKENLPARSLVALNVEKNQGPLNLFIEILILWRQGFTPVIIPPQAEIREKENYLNQTPAKATFSLFRSQNLSLKDFPNLSQKLNSSPFSSLENKNEFIPPSQGIVIFTSGSTGPPKGVHLSLSNLYHSALGTNEFYQYREEDEWALTLPSHHVGGLLIFIRSLLAGATVSLPTQKWESALLKSTTFLSLVPTQLKTLLERDDHGEALRSKLPHLKTILLGGAHTPKNLLKRGAHKNWPLYITYGQTEMAAQVTSTKVNEYLKGHTGRPLSYRQINISSTGQILLGGKTRFEGHYTQGEFLKPFDEGGQYPSHDLGTVDSDGNLIIQGRKDDVFICGGENVSPQSLKEKLARILEKNFPTVPVKDFLFLPLESEKFGQLPGLYYQFKPGSENSQIFQFESHLFKHLSSWPAHERPRLLCYDPETNENLKLQKPRAKELLETQWKYSQLSLKAKIWGDPTKKQLLFLHGFMGSHRDAEKVYEQLLKFKPDLLREYAFIGIDLPGHGLNQKENRDIPSFEETSKELAQVLMKLIRQGQNTSLWGYSMGGRFLMNTLIHHFPSGPEREKIEHVFIQSASPGPQSQKERENRQQKDATLFERLDPHQDPEEFYQNWYAQELFGELKTLPSFQESLKEKGQDWSFKRSFYQKAAINLSVSQQPQLLKDLHLLPGQTHFLYGEHDYKYREILGQAHKNHPNSRLYELRGSHAAHLESPNYFTKKLFHVLKGQPGHL